MTLGREVMMHRFDSRHPARRLPGAIALAFALCASPGAGADTLELHDGRVLTGTFVGASSERIHFRVDGAMHHVRLRAVRTARFSEATAEAASRGAPATGRAVIVGEGTPLAVRVGAMQGEADLSGELAADLVANDVVVAPAGSPVVVPSAAARGAPGRALTARIRVGNRWVPVPTVVGELPPGPGGVLDLRVGQPFTVRVPAHG